MATIACDFNFIGPCVSAKLAAIFVVRRDLALTGWVLAFSFGVCHSRSFQSGILRATIDGPFDDPNSPCNPQPIDAAKFVTAAR
jgi:hypothetical protein